jgi:hypothetical protein
MCQKAESKYKELAKYYAEDPIKVSPEEFFSVIEKFLSSLKAAFDERKAQKQEQEKKAKQEEKKAARKAAAASKKKKGNPKEGVLDNIMEAASSGEGFRELRKKGKGAQSSKKLTVPSDIDDMVSGMGI